MSETARKLFEGLRSVNDRLRTTGQEIFSQAAPEVGRLGTQGSMELASLLFNGHGFVPYGPGQYTPSPEHQPAHGLDQQQSRSMERQM
jgi:hypothetical protein